MTELRIVAPAAKAAEVAPLAAAGADEIYCGIVPPDWVARFGSGAANRRLFANLRDYAELADALAAAHGAGAALSLVVNAQHYAAAQIPALIEMAQRFDALGGDALIVADPGLIGLLSEAGLRARLHLSSVAAARNVEAARFAGELGARRVILPRDITLGEACRLSAELGGMECEVFVLNDGCAFEEGLCQTLHLPARLGGPICLDRYEANHGRRDGVPLAATQAAALAANDAAHRRWLWYRSGCGFSVTAEGLPFGPCGLCAMPALHAAGITAVKIAGREAPLARKLASVRLVAEVREHLLAGVAPAEIAARARLRRGALEHCQDGGMCYYPAAGAVPSVAPAARQHAPATSQIRP